jgi:hypothetical protein
MNYLLRTVLLSIWLFSSSLFGQSLNISQATNGAVTVYPVNPGSRGQDIVAMFTTLNQAPFKITRASQIAIQTTNNGLITNIQSITPMKNYTILLIGYLLPSYIAPTGNVGKNDQNLKLGYAAIMIEQIVELIYSPTIMNVPSALIYSSMGTSVQNVFTSKVPQGTLPVFSVDLAKRGEDISEVLTYLINPPIATPGSAYTPVSLITGVSGPYYQGAANTSSTPLFTNGVIPRVQSVSTAMAPNGTLLLVTFIPLQTNPYVTSGSSASVVVAPDQIFGIVFTQN